MSALTQEDFIKDFTSKKVSIRLNEEKNGVEVKFADIPLARRENSAIKAAGFRWSGRQQLWYVKRNEKSLDYAVTLRSKILSEMEQNGEKTYSAKEFNSEIEKELESAFYPKQSYENVKTENVSEVDGELEKLLKQQEEINRKIAELKQKQTQKKALDKSSFDKENVNSYNYNNLHSVKSTEENHEGEKSSGNAAGESEDNREQDEHGNPGSPLAEHNNRSKTYVGGDSGGGHGGAGHGDNIRQGVQAAEFRGNISASSDDSPVSDGHIRQSDEGQDSNGNAGLLHSGVREGRLADGLSELHGGDESAGHGDGLLRQEIVSKAEMRKIREKCKEILKKTDSEITEDEKKILSLYEGGGGLKEQDASSNETLNAFYTPRNVIKAVWNLADHYAPKAKTVLEPTSGIGRFAENRPQNEFTLREVDETSARIAKILHPNADVIQGDFQAQFFDENGIFRLKNYEMPNYDLVIGNPPYGVYTGEWKGKGEGKEHNRYEEYFIEKGLDSLKDENSILAFVVPSGWLRSGIDGIKHKIAEKGELIDAYRLPNKAFPTTEVGTDIIVMRSWENQKNIFAETDTKYAEEQLEARIEAEAEKISSDQWFKNHPEKVLGETKEITNRFGKPDFEVVLPENVSLDDELRRIDGFVAESNYENALNKVSSGLEAYVNRKISKNELDELGKKYSEAAGLLGKNVEKTQVQTLNNNSEIIETSKRRDTINEIMAKSKSVWDSQNKAWQNIARSFNRAIINEDYKEAKNVFDSMKNDKPFNEYVDLWKQALYIRDGKSSKLEQFENYLAEHEAPSWSSIAERAEGKGWSDNENADYNKARRQISEYAEEVFGLDLEKSEVPEEAIDDFVKNHKEISFDKDSNLLIDDSLIKPENFSSCEISNICEKKYGFYFEYDDHENLADVYSKDGDLVGSSDDGGFGYAGPNMKVQIPDDYARQIIGLAGKYFQAVQKENFVEQNDGKTSKQELSLTTVERKNIDNDYEMSEKEFDNFANNIRHAEEDFLQGKDQEDDELASSWANEDFDRTQRLDEIVSEIRKSDFKMEVSVENDLRKVILTNKNGEEIFREQETGNSIVPITSNVAAWANDAESERFKNLADEYFNIISEDGVTGGDFVNKVFEKEENPSLEEIANQLEMMEVNIRNENGWISGDDIVSSNDNARKYLEEIKSRTATNLELDLGKEGFSIFTILEADNYHTLNDALGILGVYGKEYQQKVLENLEKYPNHLLLPLDVAKEFVNDLILKNSQITPVMNKNENNISFFVKDTAEFEQFAQFEAIKNLTAEEAVKTFIEKKEKNFRAGIGINIPGDFIFNDPNCAGAIVLDETKGKVSFYMGDSFVKELKENNEHSQNVIKAFKELDEAVKKSSIFKDGLYEEPTFLFDKEKELGLTQWYETVDAIENSYHTEQNSKAEQKEEDAKNLKAVSDEENAHRKFIDVQDIRSIHGRTLIAKNEFGNYLLRTEKPEKLVINEYEKENELFVNLFNQNQIYGDYASKQATSFVLEKLKAAGIEVVTDKEEFERRLDEINGTDVFQAMTEKFVEKEINSVPRATAEIKSAIKDALEKTAVPLAEVVYSRENYRQIFRDGIIQSPVETIKMGQNQFMRLCPPDRNNLMGAIYETITKPAIVLEKETFDEKSQGFKPVHVYGKSFINEKNNHTHSVESIIIFRDGENIAASLHFKGIPKFVNQIKTADDIIYIDNEVSRVAAFSSRTGDSHVVKETQEFLSSAGRKSLPLINSSYNPTEILSIQNLIKQGKIEAGRLEITKENFDKYFNIFNQNTRVYKDNPNKIASDLLNFHVKAENRDEMKKWLEEQGYKISGKQHQFKISNGRMYGFTDGEKIYLNPDFMNSNVAVHEYTHLWDEYTRRTNPELWQKGMNIFKDTKLFNEVRSDPNYADIADDDNLVLSEVHARITGEMAQKILERIAKEDGEIKKEKAIDWNDEVFEYVYDEFGFGRNSAFAKENGKSNGYVWSDYADFLVTPLKDLMNEKNIFVQKKNTVASERHSSNPQEKPLHKERAEIKNQKPFIEESFERLNKTEPKNPLIEANALNKAFYGDENMQFQEVRLSQITDRDWRSMKGGNYPWGFRQIFDVETKSAVLVGKTESSANGKVFDAINIVAEMDSDGNFKPHFDRLSDDYKKLTDAKKNNLDDLLLEFQKNAKNFQDKFIGEKDGKFYFKDASTNLGFNYRYNSAFLRVNENRAEQIGFDTNNFRFSAITEDKEENSAYLKNCYEKKGDDRYNWYYGKPFYARFDSLYSENGADFNQVLEDDSLVHASVDSKIGELQNELDHLGWSNDDYKRRDEIISEIVNLPFAESLKMSGLTKVDYEEKIKDFNERKAQNENVRKENETKILLIEQDVNPKLDKIIESDFALGKEIPLSDSNFEVAFCSQDAKDKNQINVFINEEAAFAVNNSTFTVTAFNNYPLTKDFLLQMREKWNGELNINSSELQIEKPSLDKILEKKPVSENQKNFASALSDFVLLKEGYEEKDGKKTKYAEIEGNVVKAVRSGTKTKVFFGKSMFSAVEYDAKTDILLLNQDAYDKGIMTSLEKSLREKVPNISVTKDAVVENRHYIDTNGKTIIAPPKPARFNPEKESTMDNEEFARIYGKNWNKDERVFWEATDYKGYVNLSKLSEAEKESLFKDENYVTEQNGKIIHKELFTSGNIYRKLGRNEEFLNEGKIDNASYERNKKILEEAKPKPIPVESISVSVISPFVENYKIDGVPLKDKFLIWATGSSIEDSPNSVAEITDFSIAEISRDDIPPTISWNDVKSYVYGEELEKVKGIDDDEKRAQIRNQKRNDRKETAERLFARFIHQGLTKEEQNDFAEKYNRTFNYEKSPDYSKLPLFVDGMNQWRKGKEFKLYEQQIKGISFLCNKGNGLLAYDVGLGKTAAGIVATVVQIQSGRASRPIIVVPKSVIGKWEDDIHELFPDIPVNNLGNFSREQVGAFYDGNHGLNIPTGSITLVTKDALNNICFGKKVIDDYLFNDYADLLSLNDDLHDQNPNVRAKAREKIYEKAGVAEQVRSMYYIQWDKTGFDHITVDEAHAYKNLFKVPRPKKGETSEYAEMGSGEPSKRALKMFNMTQIIQQQNENRNVFMLTATPFTNSALEVYSMLSYIARKELEENGIKDLNDFCKQYAMTRYEKAVTKGGKDIKYKNVMKSFNDLPGLQNILRQYIDKVDGAEQEKSSIDFRHSFVRPKKETHTVFLDTTDLQEKIFDFAVHVMDYTPSEKDIANRQKNGKKGFAPTLEAMNLMRTACLSPALVDQEKLNELLSMVDKKGEFGTIEVPPLKDVVECSPKLKMVCDTVISNWKAHKECGQVVYMPEGTEAYPHIIDYMEKNGISREVFAIIDGSSCKIAGKNVTAKMIGESSKGVEDDEDIASDKRAFVAEKFNDKKNPCKILIGSSAISEGMDLNGNSIALYNCMLGWNPTEDVQVEGRIWRQGNEQGKVHIVYPLVYDSIDSLLYQKHSEKQSRINALFDYKDSSTLNVEDINPEELKYELIKDPVIRAKLEIGDKQIELKKEIVLLENQLKDYDQLVESRMKYKERLSEKEIAKKSYIQNYRESVAKGNAKRGPEEQKEGIVRFDKSISDCKKQIENVRRKFAEMEIFTDEDEHNFAVKIIQKKELIQKDIDSLFAPEYQKKVVEKYQKILFEEKLKRTQKEAEAPLDKTIQSDMKPMHIVEHEKKLEKFQRFMKIAEEDGNKKMIQTLNENWNEYEKFYKGKYGEKKISVPENVEKPCLNPIFKTEVVPIKVQETQDSIIKVLHHEIKRIDLEKTNYGSSSGLLFEFPEESQDVKKIARRVQNTQAAITAENFAENLEKSLKGIELQKENILKAAKHLIHKMSNDEKMKFVKLSVQLGVNNAEKTNEFFTKMAKGELKLVPNKKPPVIHKKTAVEAELSM